MYSLFKFVDTKICTVITQCEKTQASSLAKTSIYQRMQIAEASILKGWGGHGPPQILGHRLHVA
jgi:hypothetical protein